MYELVSGICSITDMNRYHQNWINTYTDISISASLLCLYYVITSNCTCILETINSFCNMVDCCRRLLIRLYLHPWTCLHPYTHKHTYGHTCTHAKHTHTGTYILTRERTHIPMHAHTYTQTYTHTQTHTHTHTHIQILFMTSFNYILTLWM